MCSSCPVCLGNDIRPFTDREWIAYGKTFRLALCSGCGSVHTTPLPEDAILQHLYATSFDYRWYRDHYDAKLRDCRIRIKEYAHLLEKRVLDFGGGVGYFSTAATEVGLESITYDPYVTTSPPAKGSWNSVVALHVLEHSNDLDRTISEIKELLLPSGRLILAVPNFDCLGYKRMGMDWVWAQPPLIHIHHFTATGVAALLGRHGFVDIRTSYHERWDANNFCDIEHAERFHRWDSAWGLRPLKAIPVYRRLIAYINSRRRFRGLAESVRDFNSASDIYSELQITAILET